MTEPRTDRQAAVIGATGGIGRALFRALDASGAYQTVTAFSRQGDPGLDLADEASIETAAASLKDGPPLRLVIDATGLLHGDGVQPEKTWRALDAAALAHQFQVNAIGPALLMKHMLPLLPRAGRSVFATLSARVSSIGDNAVGGWYGYRASKAALNQFVRTAAIELRRTRQDAICVALHPGTVATALSQPFAKTGLDVRTPSVAADDLLAVIAKLTPEDSGGFFDQRGDVIPW